MRICLRESAKAKCFVFDTDEADATAWKLSPEDRTSLLRVCTDLPYVCNTHYCCRITKGGRLYCVGLGVPVPGQPIVEGIDAPDWSEHRVGTWSDLVDVAPNYRSLCAVRREGSIVCWGEPGLGTFGEYNRKGDVQTVTIPGIRDATRIVPVTPYSYCAFRRSGKVACWGGGLVMAWELAWAPARGSYDPCENTPTNGSLRPRNLPYDDIEQVNRTCVVRRNGKTLCWEAERCAMLDDFEQAKEVKAPEVRIKGDLVVKNGELSQMLEGDELGPFLPSFNDVRSHIGRADQGCLLRASGEVVCWGVTTVKPVRDDLCARAFPLPAR